MRNIFFLLLLELIIFKLKIGGLLGAGNSNSIIGTNNGRSNNGINSSNNISKIFVKNVKILT